MSGRRHYKHKDLGKTKRIDRKAAGSKYHGKESGSSKYKQKQSALMHGLHANLPSIGSQASKNKSEDQLVSLLPGGFSHPSQPPSLPKFPKFSSKMSRKNKDKNDAKVLNMLL